MDKRIPFVTNDEQIRAIDEWRRRQPDLPSRAEAIRRMIDLVLGQEGTPGGAPPQSRSRRRTPSN